MTRSQFATVLAISLLPTVLAGCVTDPVTGRSKPGIALSEQEEAQMGRDARPPIVQQFGGAYPDAALAGHLGGIVQRITRNSVRPGLPWTFTVLNSSVPNAFALPGGPVFVTRGLLVELDDEAEFVVVMGHEIGHVEHRHALQRSAPSLLIGGVVGIGESVIGQNVATDLLSGAGALLDLRYSRDNERESDVRGVRHAYDLGYDPREGADLFRMFERLKGGQGGGLLEAWTSSHPLDSERIANVLELATEVDPRFASTEPVEGFEVTNPTWEKLIERLTAEHAVYRRFDKALPACVEALKNDDRNGLKQALVQFGQCAKDLPEHATFHTATGFVKAVLEDPEGARESLQRAADLDQGLVLTEQLLASVLLGQDDAEGALRHASKGVALLPGYYPCVYVRGRAKEALGDRAGARADYEAVVRSAPRESPEARDASARLAGHR